MTTPDTNTHPAEPDHIRLGQALKALFIAHGLKGAEVKAHYPREVTFTYTAEWGSPPVPRLSYGFSTYTHGLVE